MSKLFAFNVAEPVEVISELDGSYDPNTQLWQGNGAQITATGCTAYYTTQSCIRTFPGGASDCKNVRDCYESDTSPQP